MLPELASLNVPHIEQYFGVWAVYEQVLVQAVQRVNAMDLLAHVQTAQARAASAADGGAADDRYHVHAGGVAQIDIVGTMTKYGSSLSSAGSTVETRRQLRAASMDPAVRSIVLRIDSPGGTVAGTGDLADDVRQAATRKPVWAFIEDLGASAAYHVASQATRVIANPSALVGSIGVYAVITDSSKAAERAGLAVHVIRAGDFKGVGTPGTAITEEHLAEFQRRVDDAREIFVAAVASGRRMPKQRALELADGRVHVAGEALKLGLIDAVQSLDATLEQLAAGRTTEPNRGTRAEDTTTVAAGDTEPQTMAEETKPQTPATPAPATPEAPKAATIAELKAACKGAPADFLLAQIEAGATVDQAVAAHRDLLQAALQNRDEELQKAKEEAAKAEKKPGVPPLADGKAKDGNGEESDGDAGDFKSLVDANIKAGMPREKAWSKAIRDNREAYEAYIDGYNAAHGRKR